MSKCCFLAILIFHSSCIVADDGGQTAAERMLQSGHVLVIAHRGDSRALPENTLPAFESAVKVGADLVELDYVHTSDEVPVVIHDVTLDRTTDADEKWQAKQIRVSTKSLEEVETLDAGSWFDPKFAGTKLPTLEQALDTIQKGSMTLIERKEGDAKTCIELLERKKLLGDVFVQSFDWKFLSDCHQRRPDLVLCALGQGNLPPERLDVIQKSGAKAVGWQYLSLREEPIKSIHDRGMKVYAWTVDDPKAAERLIGWGVDGIITNVPAVMKEVVAKTTRSDKRS